jgi:hypothetical protein
MSDISTTTLLLPLAISLFLILLIHTILLPAHRAPPPALRFDYDSHLSLHRLQLATHSHTQRTQTIIQQNNYLVQHHRALKHHLVREAQVNQAFAGEIHAQLWQIEADIMAALQHLQERVLGRMEEEHERVGEVHRQVWDVEAEVERMKRMLWFMQNRIWQSERGDVQDSASQDSRRSEAARGPPPSPFAHSPGDEGEGGVWMRGGGGEEQKHIDTDALENSKYKLAIHSVAQTVNLGVESSSPPSFPPERWKCNDHGRSACSRQCTPPTNHNITSPRSSEIPHLRGSGSNEQSRKRFGMKGEGEGWSSSDSDEINAEVQLTTMDEEKEMIYGDVLHHEHDDPSAPSPSIRQHLWFTSTNPPNTIGMSSVPPPTPPPPRTKLPPTDLTPSSEPIYLLPNACLSNLPLSAFIRPYMHPGWQCPPGGYTLEWDRRGTLRPLGVEELKREIDEAYEGTKDWEEVVREDEARWVRSEMGDWIAREQ